MTNLFTYSRRVNLYETDLMGIVHHSNYLRICEEARVEWCLAAGILSFDKVETAFSLAVIKSAVAYLKPCRFGDELSVQVQVKRERARLVFEYKFICHEQVYCEIRTEHAALDLKLKPMRLSPQIIEAVERSKWTETWLLNL